MMFSQFRCAHCDAALITFNRYSKRVKQYNETMPNFHVICYWRWHGCIYYSAIISLTCKQKNKKINLQAAEVPSDTINLDQMSSALVHMLMLPIFMKVMTLQVVKTLPILTLRDHKLFSEASSMHSAFQNWEKSKFYLLFSRTR